VKPTVYGYAHRQTIDTLSAETGISTDLANDIRWGRCDIKSTALLANVMAYQAAHDRGFKEVCFVRNGLVTEGAHSNIFFVREGTLYTHPESNDILSGITRKNIISVARANSISVVEEAVAADMIPYINEAFLCNTTGEIVPIVKITDKIIGEGTPGPLTRRLQTLLRELIQAGFQAGMV
jgi:D-alanine transaminase